MTSHMATGSRGLIGGVLLSVALIIEFLNAYQVLDGLLLKLRQHGAVFVADAIVSPKVLIALGVVGLFLIFDWWRTRRNIDNSPVGAQAIPSVNVTNSPTFTNTFSPQILIQTPDNDVRANAQKSEAAAGRIVVDVPPEYLTSFYKEHTTIQADKLAATYIGKWLMVSGPLADIMPMLGSSSKQVTLKRDSLATYFQVFMYFSEEWTERLSVLRRGDNIAVVGQIERVNGIEVHLRNCELVDS